MIVVSVVFLLLLVIGVPVAVAVGAAGYIGALLAAPAPLATSVQTILHQVDSFVLLSGLAAMGSSFATILSPLKNSKARK